MKRNRKGFTLVELLAVVVILGILAIFAVPTIINMVTNSRSKIYVADAQKLIAAAEYRIKASNSNIEKPDPGDCIAISLDYLESSDFDSPPNDGVYQKENSFVIVKNTGTTLEYSATIVEKMKSGGYMGVELTSNNELLSSNALSHVKVFTKEELIDVETDITRNYINKQLGNDYITSDGKVTEIYNHRKLEDYSAQTPEDGVPKIISATLTSTSKKSFNSLDATLTLKVDDTDTARSKLKVYLSTVSYEDALKAANMNEYGTEVAFKKDFDFSGSYSYNGAKVLVYVIVRDPEGNEARKKLEYVLHKNTGPEIDKDKSGLFQRSTDPYAMTIATLKLSVSDDIDDADTLMVCLTENTSATSCSNYKSYQEYFGTIGSMDYSFTCGSGCSLNGANVGLKIFVRDSGGLSQSEVFSYTFYNNQPPKFSGDITITSNIEKFTDGENGGSLITNVSFDVEDDLTDSSNITVTLSDESNSITQKYDFYNGIDFTFGGSYDGGTRTLTVKITDEFGSSTTKKQTYKVYSNQAPTIQSVSLESDEPPCTNDGFCSSEDGGNYHTSVFLDISDDIDEDVDVCISDKANDCNSSSNYQSYESVYKNRGVPFTFTVDSTNPYDGSDKTLYVYAKDSSNQISSITKTYTLYKNKAPEIQLFTIESSEESFTNDGSLDVFASVEAVDDISLDEDLKITLSDGNNSESYSYSDYIDNLIPFHLSGGYDGKERTITLTVEDEYGKKSTQSVLYTVYKMDGPEIVDVLIESDGVACLNEEFCLEEDGGSNQVNVLVSTMSDLDLDMKVCLAEDSTKCENTDNYVSYEEELSYTFSVSSKPYTGVEKTLYIYVMDSNGAVSSTSKKYTLYSNKAPVFQDDYPIVHRIENEEELNFDKITFEMEAYDDLDEDSSLEAKVCYTVNDNATEVCVSDYSRYKNIYHLDLSTSEYTGQTYHLYAYVKDSYGSVSKSNSVSYKVFEDISPQFLELHASKGVEGYDSNQVVISASIKDLYDTYQICINTSNECSNYDTTTYNGNDLKSHIIPYTLTDSSITSLYVFARDSHNHIISLEVSYDIYDSCENLDYQDAKYNYVVNDDSEKISAERCLGKCYYWDAIYSRNEDDDYLDENGQVVSDKSQAYILRNASDTATIQSYYKTTISYRDKFVSDKYCGSNEAVEEVHCDFKDCFYNTKTNSYESSVIGLAEFEGKAFTVTIGGTTYVSTSYYKMYSSSYVEGNQKIDLNETSNKVPIQAVLDGKYNYNKNTTDPFGPYLRALDIQDIGD